MSMKKQFTGRHMFFIFLGGFGIIFAVNATMATLAVTRFGGVIVENSYVASQEFNGWLATAEKQRALGWTAQSSRDEAGYLHIASAGIPEGTIATAVLRRPMGSREIVHVDFGQPVDQKFTSLAPIPEGRWLVRLNLSAGEDLLELEQRVE